MLHELLGINNEASQVVDALMNRFRLLHDDAALSEFQRRQHLAQLRAICGRLETFVDTHSASLPPVLTPCLRCGGHCGGHFDPLLLLLEEAAQSAPFRSGDWPQFLDQAEKLAKKIGADVALIQRTLEELGIKDK